MTSPEGPAPKFTQKKDNYKAFCSGSFNRRNRNEPRIPISFSLPAKDQWILEGIERLARMEYGSKGRSKIIKKFLIEGLNRHLPGNPQQPLTSAFSEPALSSIERMEAGIRFLRARNKLSLRTIAKITRLSYRQVYKICGSIPGDAKRLPREFFRLEQYQQRWSIFIRGLSPEEAFKF